MKYVYPQLTIADLYINEMCLKMFRQVDGSVWNQVGQAMLFRTSHPRFVIKDQIQQILWLNSYHDLHI
jgi:hypothetical protein